MAASNFISMGARLPDCKQSTIPAGTARRSTLFASVDCKIKRLFQHLVVFELMFAEKFSKHRFAQRDAFDLPPDGHDFHDSVRKSQNITDILRVDPIKRQLRSWCAKRGATLRQCAS